MESSTFIGLVIVILLLSNAGLLGHAQHGGQDSSNNKFRQREATDDQLPYPNFDEESLTNTQCPQHVELRWRTEVSSSVYATPLVADINSDGKLEVVVPSFVHNIEVLDGTDGEKLPGWPATHLSNLHSSPLLYDIDKDGVREIVAATYHGEVIFFRPSGYQVPEKLVLPRERVRKDWYVGLNKDHADRSHSDVKDEGLKAGNFDKSPSTVHSGLAQGNANISATTFANKSIAGVSTTDQDVTNKSGKEAVPTDTENREQSQLSGATFTAEPGKGNLSGNSGHIATESGIASSKSDESAVRGALRRLLEDSRSDQTNINTEDKQQTATVENDQETFGDISDASFEVFRDEEENMEDGLTEEYQYDYDDYVDESLWGDENWKEAQHEKSEDFISIDAHILCTPVIADIDKDGVDEMIIATSYFFDHEYYDNPENSKELGDVDISKFVACSILVFNLDTKQLKWKKLLDLSTDEVQFRAHIYSSPTVVDLDKDGFLDIVVGTSYGLCYVLDHKGEFREHFPLLMGEIQGQILAADINDDGLVELVTTDNRGNVAAWSTKAANIWEVHLKSMITQGPTMGDIDGDGTIDIVVPTVSGNIYVLNGKTGAKVKQFPFRTHGRVMAPVLLVDLGSVDAERKSLTLVVTAFDGYLYLIDGATGCADVIDVGETSYTMVLADNIDGGEDLDLIVTTMNGNVFCFSTPAPYHPLRTWTSYNQGRNFMGVRENREGILALPGSRAFRDEGGESFWVQFNIVDKNRIPSGPYNVTATLLVPHNYMGSRRITESRVIEQPGRHQFKLPCVSVRSSGQVILEMVDKNGFYFSDEFSLTFHMHYYRLLKWMVVLPMMGMFLILLWLHPDEAFNYLPSFSRDQ